MSFLVQSHRAMLATALLLLGAGLSACTTVEGTNALVSPDTFEREVARETLKGLGMVPREEKAMVTSPRAPLVLPKSTASLPEPQEESAADAMLPVDSDTVKIDMTGLTEDDLKRLRNARVFDARTASGRPLTEAETRQLAARMKDAHVAGRKAEVSLFVPPDEYFEVSHGGDLICLAPNGDLVRIDDPKCPEDVRTALQKQQAQGQ